MAQHYIKQLIFSWLRMVHRKVIDNYNRERCVPYYNTHQFSQILPSRRNKDKPCWRTRCARG